MLEHPGHLRLHSRGTLVCDDRRSNFLQKLLRAVDDDDLGRAWSCAGTLNDALSAWELATTAVEVSVDFSENALLGGRCSCNNLRNRTNACGRNAMDDGILTSSMLVNSQSLLLYTGQTPFLHRHRH